MKILFRCDPALRDLLPRPVPARAALPDWLRRMPARAASALHTEPVRTVKQCPPFVDAMAHGFVLPLPCDVHVNDGRITWDWPIPKLGAALHPRAPIAFHAPAQLAGSPFHDPDQVAIKFNCFWTVALEPGWSLLALHPINRADLPFRLLSGLVDADRFHDVGILFPAIWTDRSFAGVLPRGTPVAQCVPVRRDPLDLEFAVFEAAETGRFQDTAEALLAGPGHYRKHFRASGAGAFEGAPEQGGFEEHHAAIDGYQRLRDPAETLGPQPEGNPESAECLVEPTRLGEHDT